MPSKTRGHRGAPFSAPNEKASVRLAEPTHHQSDAEQGKAQQRGTHRKTSFSRDSCGRDREQRE